MLDIYYINLDRVPERKRYMEVQFQAQGLSAFRIPAVDALNNYLPPEYAPESWLERWSIRKSVLACFESHRRGWRKICEGDAPFGIIMEDDAILSSTFSSYLPSLVNAAPFADVIKLDGINQVRRFGPASDVGGVKLRSINQSTGSAAAYLVSKEGAGKLEARASRYCNHPDDFIFSPNRDWKPMQLDPAIVVQGMFIKQKAGDEDDLMFSSERTLNASVNMPTNKGPILYRLSKELKRSAQKLNWAVWRDRQLLANGGIIGYPTLIDDLGRYR